MNIGTTLNPGLLSTDTGGEYNDLEREMERAMAWKQEYDRLMEREGDEEAGTEPDEH